MWSEAICFVSYDPRYQGAYSCILHKPCVYELEFITRIQKGTYLMKVS